MYYSLVIKNVTKKKKKNVMGLKIVFKQNNVFLDLGWNDKIVGNATTHSCIWPTLLSKAIDAAYKMKISNNNMQHFGRWSHKKMLKISIALWDTIYQANSNKSIQ